MVPEFKIEQEPDGRWALRLVGVPFPRDPIFFDTEAAAKQALKTRWETLFQQLFGEPETLQGGRANSVF